MKNKSSDRLFKTCLYCDGSDMTRFDLAALLVVNPSTAYNYAMMAVASGYLEVVKHGREDAKSYFRITPKGRQFVGGIKL